MKVSVIIRCRNEYPIILGTLHAIQEDLEWSGLDHEIIVVDNMSTDSTADILEDRYRRWVKSEKLKIVRYNDRASTWGAINRGYEESSGDVIVVCDAHITVKTGSINLLAYGAMERGGIWHAPVQMWGDTEDTRRYGHDIKLVEKFWGDPCPYPPPGEGGPRPWKIPMAGACFMAISRKEIEQFGLYDQAFRSYGGGEPYLGMKWWMCGSAVWMEPRALCRHAFGIKANWERAPRDKTVLHGSVYKKSGEITKELKKGDEYIRYVPGYEVPNEDHYFNFMLAAFLIGGVQWLSLMTESFKAKLPQAKMSQVFEAVLKEGKAGRDHIVSIARHQLDDLLVDPPWDECAEHEVKLPEWLTQSTS